MLLRHSSPLVRPCSQARISSHTHTHRTQGFVRQSLTHSTAKLVKTTTSPAERTQGTPAVQNTQTTQLHCTGIDTGPGPSTARPNPCQQQLCRTGPSPVLGPRAFHASQRRACCLVVWFQHKTPKESLPHHATPNPPACQPTAAPLVLTPSAYRPACNPHPTCQCCTLVCAPAMQTQQTCTCAHSSRAPSSYEACVHTQVNNACDWQRQHQCWAAAQSTAAGVLGLARHTAA